MKIPPSVLSEQELRKLIEDELLQSGWSLSDQRFIPPTSNDKQSIRDMHQFQRLERSRSEISLVQRYRNNLLAEFANGYEVNPKEFNPELVQVNSTSWENNIFRFATLLWSVPVSRGYGRRMRYLVRDGSNGKLVGIFALMDPVFNLKVRDKHIGWNASQREDNLYKVMDAYILGAVPPYNLLLCGKMIALSVISNQIRSDFHIKYSGQKTQIREEIKDASLVLITTTSALGKSSIYNRIQIPGEEERAFRTLGFSSGWGHFQFSDITFEAIRDWLRSQNDPYADGNRYGNGPNWRMRVIRRALDRLGFDGDSLNHGIKREVFIAPLAKNYRDFLCDRTDKPEYFDRDLGKLTDYFRERWMIPRSQTTLEWRTWSVEDTWRSIAKNLDQPINSFQHRFF